MVVDRMRGNYTEDVIQHALTLSSALNFTVYWVTVEPSESVWDKFNSANIQIAF